MMTPPAVLDLIAYPRYYLRRHNYLFLLSHMRCYSSLLGRILGSNPDIAGYAELHLSYCNLRDLFRMKRHIKKILGRQSINKKMLFGKLLNNKHCLSSSIVKSKNANIIISIRQPAETISSIVNMGKAYHNDGWYTDPERVVRYYVARLHVLRDFMETYSSSCGNEMVFFQAELLVRRSSDLLDELSAQLRLDTPLSSKYRTFDLTGKPGLGDPSPNIKAGEIIHKDEGYDKINIDPCLLKVANAAYNDTLTIAHKHCKVLCNTD